MCLMGFRYFFGPMAGTLSRATLAAKASEASMVSKPADPDLPRIGVDEVIIGGTENGI